jgi:hypothetical protein
MSSTEAPSTISGPTGPRHAPQSRGPLKSAVGNVRRLDLGRPELIHRVIDSKSHGQKAAGPMEAHVLRAKRRGIRDLVDARPLGKAVLTSRSAGLKPYREE